MVELVIEIAKKSLISIGLVAIAGLVFSEIFNVGENPFQSVVVLSFYVYCAISLFFYSSHKLFHVLALPILTQFIHIFQKYSFTTGANSIWRLLPFLLLNLYFANFFLGKKTDLSQKSRLFIFSWLILNTFFLLISPNLDKVVWGGIVLYLLTLPLSFLYLNLSTKASDFRSQIEMYFCLLFIILGLGTFGLVFVGAGYKGSDNLLATRNIADTNVTMAYFILLWPFVLLYFARNTASQLFKLAMLLIFAGVVILSFSRGAVLIVVPYLLLTTLLSKHFLSLKWILPVLILSIVYNSSITGFLEKQDLVYFWRLRFGEITSFESLLAKLESISGRVEIHQIAYSLFLQSPLTGHGIGSFEVLGPGYREAHSMWYTLLAEEGIIGVVYVYGIFVALCIFLAKCISTTGKSHFLLLTSLLFYLFFSHTVGSAFIIIPGKSITINCIAPIIIMCLYFYAKSLRNMTFDAENSNNDHL